MDSEIIRNSISRCLLLTGSPRVHLFLRVTFSFNEAMAALSQLLCNLYRLGSHQLLSVVAGGAVLIEFVFTSFVECSEAFQPAGVGLSI